MCVQDTVTLLRLSRLSSCNKDIFVQNIPFVNILYFPERASVEQIKP